MYLSYFVHLFYVFCVVQKKSSVILLPLLKKKKDEDKNYPYDVHTFKKTGDNLIMKHDISNDDFELWEIYK